MMRRQARQISHPTGAKQSCSNRFCRALAWTVTVKTKEPCTQPKPTTFTPSSCARVKPMRLGARVSITIPYKATWGTSLALVGSASCLGCWDVSKRQKMTWSEGDYWSAEFITDPSVTTVEYKFILVDDKRGGKVLAWSPDPNKKLDLSSLTGCSILVADHWEPTIPRDVKLVMEQYSSRQDSPGSHSQSTNSIESFAMLTPSSMASPQQRSYHLEASVAALKIQLEEVSSRVAEFDELRHEVAQLLVAGSSHSSNGNGNGNGAQRPPRITSKQLTELTQQLTALEDLREMTAELRGGDRDRLHQCLSQEQVLDLSRKLSRYDDIEASLTCMVGQLRTAGGGCPLQYAVGKSIAQAARNPIPACQRPWRGGPSGDFV